MALGLIKHKRGAAAKWSRKHLTAKRTREITVKVTVRRAEYRERGPYVADACVMPAAKLSRLAWPGAKRCRFGRGSSPTTAIRSAMRGLTKMMK